jgi:hypothetical protein
MAVSFIELDFLEEQPQSASWASQLGKYSLVPAFLSFLTSYI